MTLLGPIFARELFVAARRVRTYRMRADLAGFGLLILIGGVVGGSLWNGGLLSIGEMSLLMRGMFLLFAAAIGFSTLMLVPNLVAVGIAEEAERGTLAYLLTTPLTSGEIVVGKLASALLQYASATMVGLPIMIVLAMLGGIDPPMVILVYAISASTAFFLAGLSILISAGATGGRAAVKAASTLGTMWLLGAPGLEFILPRLSPRIDGWVGPILAWIASSSPFGVVMGYFGLPGAGAGAVDLAWMFGLQVACGCLFIVLAIWRLRPSYRGRQGTDGRAKSRWRVRLLPRPACGPDPVLWKELFVSRTNGFVLLVGLLAGLALFGGFSYAIYRFARPALLEVIAGGYASTGSSPARQMFNVLLRTMTIGISLLYAMLMAGLASEGITSERVRDTWSGLLATPLTGREILRAKKLGVAWKTGAIGAYLVAIWAVGLLAGAVHPIGFFAGLGLLFVSSWFAIELGTYASLVAKNQAEATNRTLLPFLILNLGVAASFVPWPVATILWASGSVPVILNIALLSYPEVHSLLLSSASRAQVWTPTGEGPALYLATYVLSVAGYAAGAAWIRRRGVTRFDRLVGRPTRNSALEGVDPTRWAGDRGSS